MCFLSQGPKVKQFMDIFSIPEMTLLAVANDFFITNDIEYDPVHLYKDVSVSKPHTLTVLNVKHYFLNRGPSLYPMLRSSLAYCIWPFSYTVILQLDAQESAESSKMLHCTLMGRAKTNMYTMPQ